MILLFCNKRQASTNWRPWFLLISCLTINALEGCGSGFYKEVRSQSILFVPKGIQKLRGGGTDPTVEWQALEILDSIIRTQRCTPASQIPPVSDGQEQEAYRELSAPVRSLRTEATVAGEVRIRHATFMDILDMQRINLVCLPENYQVHYFMYHLMQWPKLIHVAEAECGGVMRVVGYVLAKTDEDEPEVQPPGARPKGHITSLAVMRSHRKQKIAKRLMFSAIQQMVDCYGASRCSLHVRSGNKVALKLYVGTLGFAIERVEERYYADEEDAYLMMRTLDDWASVR